ncbi:MAG: DHCW motif cupin fold protein [Candidatus Aminicenantes bacterium]|nr:DHCW motif cupin fold protein [Candidatus Aminicenantes bacterium]
MKIEDLPFTVTDWNRVPAIEHRGRTGSSSWRSFEEGGLRVRVVDYSAGFESDHWCRRGHVLYVIEGELQIALKNGTIHRLKRGASFQAGDDEANPHLASSGSGARVFIVD